MASTTQISETESKASETESSDSGSLTSILKDLKSNSQGDNVTMDDILDALDNRGFGPMLVVPAILSASPIGAIPGMSVVIGSILFLIAAQMLLNDSHPWFPDRLLNFSFSRETMKSGIDKVIPWTEWIEQFLHERLTFMFNSATHYIVAILTCILSLLFFPLALLPFAVAIPSISIAFFGLGMTMRDGLLILLGYVVATIAFAVLYMYWPL